MEPFPLPAFGLLAWVVVVWSLPQRPVIDWQNARESFPATDLGLGAALPLILALLGKTDPTALIWVSGACVFYVLARWKYCYKKTRREVAIAVWTEARTIARDLDSLLNSVILPATHGGMSNAEAWEQARLMRDDNLVRFYRQRFEAIVRDLAREFRRYERTPTIDMFFRHVANGPSNEHDIFQIREGLLRLSQGVRESVTDER
jgi:hypothetical protein